jgi:hypothetical protein
VGPKNNNADRQKKKISSPPNKADAGRFFMLSMAVIIKRTKENRGIFLWGDVIDTARL